jgi:hypothetical protein
MLHATCSGHYFGLAARDYKRGGHVPPNLEARRIMWPRVVHTITRGGWGFMYAPCRVVLCRERLHSYGGHTGGHTAVLQQLWEKVRRSTEYPSPHSSSCHLPPMLCVWTRQAGSATQSPSELAHRPAKPIITVITSSVKQRPVRVCAFLRALSRSNAAANQSSRILFTGAFDVQHTRMPEGLRMRGARRSMPRPASRTIVEDH